MAPERITITIPNWLSAETGIAATGCMGGVLAADFSKSLINTAAGLTGGAALLSGILAKGIVGALSFLGAGRAIGGTQLALGSMGIGAGASALIDLVRYAYPGGAEGAGARLGAQLRGVPVVPIAPVGAPRLVITPAATTPATAAEAKWP